jgi:hypothetical protein
VLAPAAWPWPDEDVVGAEAVHRVLRGWLVRVGYEAFVAPPEASGAPVNVRE